MSIDEQELELTGEPEIYMPLKNQIGGDHYRRWKIQPVEFAERNLLPYSMSNAIKYLMRYDSKGGRQDLEKAMHYCELGMTFHHNNPEAYRVQSHEWSITPMDFVKANKLSGARGKAIIHLCQVFTGGIKYYGKARDIIQGMVAEMNAKPGARK